MGVAMAGMLAPGLGFAPARLWQAVFAAAGVWFCYHYILTRRGQALGKWRCQHPLPHLIECIAMVFMLALPAATAAGRTGMAGLGAALTGTAARFSPLTLLLALFMVGYVMWLANNLSALTPAAATAANATTTTSYLAPRRAACCKIAMAVTMGYMLIVML
jgi:hypothetical protein